MTDLFEIVRTASGQSPSDAAFFILFQIRVGEVEGSLQETLRISHPAASAAVRAEATENASKLARYCEENSGEINRETLEKEFPGLSEITYNLAEKYGNIPAPDAQIDQKESNEIRNRNFKRKMSYFVLIVGGLKVINSFIRYYNH